MWKTTMARPEDQVRDWYIIDASKHVLGKMAEKIAARLTGKDRPDWTPHTDTGAGVIVINAADLVLTGRKAEQRTYEHFTGYPSGRRVVSHERMMAKNPEFVVRRAVRLMMPRTNLSRHMLKKLRVYPGAEHPHTSQNPKELAL